MINNKKIEEAAYRFATSQTHGELLALIDGYKEGYKDAINEFIKDLWHPASEEPEKNHFVLFKTAGNSFETEYIGKNDWATIVRCFKVVKWFYVDDLLPKKGCEQ